MKDQDFSTKATIQLSKLETAMEYIKHSIENISHKLENSYVTQDQFEPIKRLVYGVVTLVLVAVVGAIMALIIKK